MKIGLTSYTLTIPQRSEFGTATVILCPVSPLSPVQDTFLLCQNMIDSTTVDDEAIFPFVDKYIHLASCTQLALAC